MVNAHVKFRCEKEGDILHRNVDYTPAPVLPGTQVRVGGSEGQPIMKDAPECINCVVNETELLLDKEGKSRCLFRITQTSIVPE